MKEHQRITRARWVGLFVVGLGGWYLAASFRTSDWGYDRVAGELLGSLRVFAIVALPFAFLPLIGAPWRRKLITVGVFTMVCVLSVEVFARAQECLLIIRYQKQTGAGFVERRWWPFEHHDVGYVQGKGWGCD